MEDNSSISKNVNVNTVSKRKTLPSVPVYVVIGILLIIIIIMIVWVLMLNQQLSSKLNSVDQNPYCLRTVCREPNEHSVVEVPMENDPQKRAYATLNYCTVNGPPEEFQRVVHDCEFGDTGLEPDANLTDKFRTFLNWYPYSYVPACGYLWKYRNVTVAPDAPVDVRNPNNRSINGTNGFHSQITLDTLECANKLGMNNGSNPGYRELYTLCGESCEGVAPSPNN